MTTFLIIVALVGGALGGHQIAARQTHSVKREMHYWRHRALHDEVLLRLPKPYSDTLDGVRIKNLQQPDQQVER